MLKLLVVFALVFALSACQVDEREPEDAGALPEPPMEEVPSPVDEEDTVEVPVHVPPEEDGGEYDGNE
jgi:hypothetical protein